MGGGDLNFKKSWHPQRMHNMEKVWLEEKKAEDEMKRTEQLKKEIEEQRKVEEMELLQEQAGLKKRSNKLEWMYASGPIHQIMEKEEKESYLLGDKKVDKILAGDNTIEGGNGLSSGKAMDLTDANTLRDTQNKIRDDPLFMIKKMEKSSLERLMNNPIKLAHMKEKKDKDKKHKSKKSSREKDEERYVTRNYRENDYNRRDLDRRDDHYRRGRSPLRSNEYRYQDSRDIRDQDSYSRYDRRDGRSRSPKHYNDNAATRYKSRSPISRRHRSSPRYTRHSSIKSDDKKDAEFERMERERKIQAMMNDAKEHESQRYKRVKNLKEEEVLEEEEHAKTFKDRQNGYVPKVIRDANNSAYNTSAALNLGTRISSRRGKLDLN